MKGVRRAYNHWRREFVRRNPLFGTLLTGVGLGAGYAVGARGAHAVMGKQRQNPAFKVGQRVTDATTGEPFVVRGAQSTWFGLGPTEYTVGVPGGQEFETAKEGELIKDNPGGKRRKKHQSCCPLCRNPVPVAANSLAVYCDGCGAGLGVGP